MARLEIPLHTQEAPILKRRGASVYIMLSVLFILFSVALTRFVVYQDTTSQFAPPDTQIIFHNYFLRTSIPANNTWFENIHPITGSTVTFGDLSLDIKKEYSWFIGESGSSLCIRSWDGLSSKTLRNFGLEQVKISNEIFLIFANNNPKIISENSFEIQKVNAPIVSLLSFREPLIGQLGIKDENNLFKMQPVFGNGSKITLNVPTVSLKTFPRSFISEQTNLAIGFPSEQNDLWNLFVPRLLPDPYMSFLPPDGIIQENTNQKTNTLLWWQNENLKAEEILPLMLAVQNPETVIQKNDEGGEYQELRLFPERVTLNSKFFPDNQRFQAIYNKDGSSPLFADEPIAENAWFTVSDDPGMLDGINNDSATIIDPIFAYAKCSVLLEMIKQNPFSSSNPLEDVLNNCKKATLTPGKNTAKMILER